MREIISTILAKISVIIFIFTLLMWLFRVSSEKNWFKMKNGKSLHDKLKKPHEIFGKILILTSLVHGILSSEKLLSLNYGTASFVMIFLVGVSCAFKKDSNVNRWRLPHKIIGIVALILLIIHLITVL